MSKFDRVLVAVGENRKEALQMVRVISVLWGKLDEQASQLPGVVQGLHELGEPVQLALQAGTQLGKLLMCNGLGNLGIENEILGGISLPPSHGSFLRKGIEG